MPCTRARASEGIRLLAVAWSAGRSRDAAILVEADERDLVFAGCCLFLDPPKASATNRNRQPRQGGCAREDPVSGDAEAVVRRLVGVLELPSRGNF